jgi:F0F1-type ATP synthase membrane subunit b/b'
MGELLGEELRDSMAHPARLLAEVVQSLLLLGLLGWGGRRYLLPRLTARREAIAAEVAGAGEAERESVRLREEAREVAARAGRETADLVQAARDQADRERRASIARLEDEAREVVAQARRSVEDDRQRVRREASERLIRLTAEAARRYLDEMLTEPERHALTRKAVLETLEEIAPGARSRHAGGS